MEIEGENDFKDRIIPKIKNSMKSLAEKKHPRIVLSDLSTIQRKKLNSYFIFYNKVYQNVSI